MTTHERELTSAVDLCDERGWLADDARGWSRAPLHRANLTGRWGRTKRWDYWAILAGDWSIAVVYADVDYLGIAEVWWCHLPTGRSGGRAANVPGARGRAQKGELAFGTIDAWLIWNLTGGKTHATDPSNATAGSALYFCTNASTASSSKGCGSRCCSLIRLKKVSSPKSSIKTNPIVWSAA